MGDRGNAYIVDTPDETHGIYLYTHWDGCIWPNRVRRALKTARPRWGDSSYCTRIMVSELFVELADSQTGGGISTTRCSGEYPIIIVDQANQTVSFAPEGDEKNRNRWVSTVSFAEYVSKSASYARV